jgi:hypothetical protein
MRIEGIVAALAAGLLLGAAPAAAIGDITGIYAMKLSCKGIDSGVKGKQKVEGNFYVSDTGTGSVRFETGAYGPAQAYLLTETAKPDLGVLSGMTCTKSALNLDGLVLRVDVKFTGADPSLKGTLLIFADGESESSTCKFTAKRTSLGPVKIAPCAEP